MNNGKIFLPLLLILFPSVVFSEIKGHGIEVRIASSKIIEAKPGGIISASFFVTNCTNEEGYFFEKIKLPNNWRLLIPIEIPFVIKPKEQEMRIIAFSIPKNFPAGNYEITYSVESQKDYEITDSDKFFVVVLPLLELESQVEEKPVTVISGESFKVKIRYINRGNIRVEIKLDIKGNPNYPTRVEPKEMALEPGEAQVLTIEIKTDEKEKKKVNYILKVKGEATGVKEGGISTEQTIFVEVLPRVTGEFDSYYRIPSKIRLIGGVAKDVKNSFQLEFSGYGNLDGEGKRRINFLFRGPDIQEKNLFGERDEYRLSFWSDPLDLHLGDRGYSLSFLTEQFLYGRGVEINIRSGKINTGAFFLNTRWVKPGEREIGSYFKYEFEKLIEIKGNFLNKRINQKDFTDNIYSIEGKIRPNEKMNIELEYGLSKSDREKDYKSYGYHIDVSGQLFEKIRYDLDKIYCGPKFYGYYHAVDSIKGTITFPIFNKLRGNISYYRIKELPDLVLEPTRSTANKETSYRGGISLPFSFGTSLSLDYEDFYRQDWLIPKEYDFREKIFKVGFGQTFPKFSVQMYMDKGNLEDKLSSLGKRNLTNYSFYGFFQPISWQSITLFARFGHNLYTYDLKRTGSWGVSTNWKIKGKLNINLNYQKNFVDLNERKGQDNLFSTISYTLPNNHLLSLKGLWRKEKERGEKEASIYVSYTIPIGIPIGKRKNIGVIKGRIYDGEKLERPPLRNVILKINESTAITDNNGQFIFPALKPGNYYLHIDRGSIGLHRTTSKKIPMITVRGGETEEIEIVVVNSCKISGKILIYAPEKEMVYEEREQFQLENLKEIGGLSNVLIEISKDDEVFRQFTDEKGNFIFEDLRPGKWMLKVYEEGLPAYHYLVEKEFQFKLEPGEQKEFTIKVIKQIRFIQIIEEGEIKEEYKKW